MTPTTHLPGRHPDGCRYGVVRTALAILGVLVTSASAQTIDPARGLTAVDGIKVGHHTLSERPTGCTVVLVEAGATAGVDVRGAAPGTRETDLLDPLNTVEQVHAIVLSGGSAFGLSVADGVMRYLSEKNIGYPMRVPVPIVPAAILYDLGVGDNPNIRPTAECGYLAARSATSGPVSEGSVGAGAGATLGKIGGPDRAMKGGIGTAAIALPNGLVVAALVAVNAVGDVVDPSTGRSANPRGPAARRRTDGRPRSHTGPHPGRREHDDRRRRHQRASHQSSGGPPGPDGTRRTRTGHSTRAYSGGR